MKMNTRQESESDGSFEMDYECSCECDSCGEGDHSFCDFVVCWKN
jgi:hypothetical protein